MDKLTDICSTGIKAQVVPATYNGEYLIMPVDDLGGILRPDRDHAYVLPDNTVWILGYDGETFIKISGGGTGNSPTAIKNDDGYVNVSGSGTYAVTIGLNEAKATELIRSELLKMIEKLSEVKTLLQNTQITEGRKYELNESYKNFKYVCVRLSLSTSNSSNLSDLTYIPTQHSTAAKNQILKYLEISAAHFANVQCGFTSDTAFEAGYVRITGEYSVFATVYGIQRI